MPGVWIGTGRRLYPQAVLFGEQLLSAWPGRLEMGWVRHEGVGVRVHLSRCPHLYSPFHSQAQTCI